MLSGCASAETETNRMTVQNNFFIFNRITKRTILVKGIACIGMRRTKYLISERRFGSNN